ncbi:MAG: peptidoglycan-binding protein LysM [Neisseriaceae bacterium]|nr:MAG: peptidoglycan-binding protein LysM [Neisseriaceae bacterium]
MSLFSFFKEAGEKIFGASDNNTDRGKKVTAHVRSYNIPGATDIQVDCNEDGVATVTGECESPQVKQMVLTATGNIEGVKEVNDKLKVRSSGKEADFYAVQKGDTLSKIAEKYYNDASKYTIIFEANKPMLTDPDKIYPGQTLIIPKA